MQRPFLSATALVALFASAGFAASEQESQIVSDTSATAKTITLIERQWLDAMVAQDIEKLNQILGDDWVDLGPEAPA